MKSLLSMLIAMWLLAAVDTTSAPRYTVTLATPPAVSSSQWESHPALDPRTGDLWFVRGKTDFSGWSLWTSRCVNDHFQTPTPSPISSVGIEADPYFTQDGGTLYFISSRLYGSSSSADLDIWTASRDSQGNWQKAIRLPSPVNSAQAEWFPRPASDGWLYFGSRRSGGFGKDDIWRARQIKAGGWLVENAGPGLNSAGAEYEFLPASNGQWGLLATDNGIYRVKRVGHIWQRDFRLGVEVNVNGTEIGPSLLGEDGSFIFSRDSEDGASGELFVAGSRSKTNVLQHCGPHMPAPTLAPPK